MNFFVYYINKPSKIGYAVLLCLLDEREEEKVPGFRKKIQQIFSSAGSCKTVCGTV